MKRTVVPLTLILALLITMIAGTQLMFFAKANFSPRSPPEVLISSPVGTVNSSNVPLSITVVVYGRFIYGSESYVESIKWITYSIDRTPQHQEDVALTLTKIPTSGQPEDKYIGNATLSSLSEGKHGLTIQGESTFNNTIYEFAYFTVDTNPPQITVLSPANATYNKREIPLNFTLNEETPNITYSLDGQSNAAITGNTTMPALSYGSHNLTVYAVDAAGNNGTSQTIYFTVFNESEVQAPPPPQHETELFPVEPVAAVTVGVAMAIVAAGFLLFHRKRTPSRNGQKRTCRVLSEEQTVL